MTDERLALNQALDAVGMPKSTWYYQARSRPPRALNSNLVAAIDALWEQTRGVYGYRKMHALLRAQGFMVNHKAVLRHLRRLDRLQPRKLKGVRWPRPRVVRPTASNTYWEMDLTCVWCGSGFGDLFAVLDAYDKGVPGACFGDRCRAVEAVQALEEAVATRFGGRVPDGHTLTLRVGRGSQFIARRLQEAAKVLGVTLEYTGIQCPDDKPYIESFFGHYKTEEVYRTSYATLAEGQVGWSLYRIWYETERVHESLGYQIPQCRLVGSGTLPSHPRSHSQRNGVPMQQPGA
jgi:putative transposase